MSGGLKPRAAVAAAVVILVGVLAYLPALDNAFLADDYAFLWLCERLSAGEASWGDFPLGGRRLTAHLFFYLNYVFFGLTPSLYYAANLLLHLANAGLVFLVGSELAGDRRVGFVAALFFVAYERHQEAVFWITAHHELLLALGVLGTAYFFARYRRTGRARFYGAALAVFVVSGATKESFLVLVPLLALVELARRTAEGRPRRSWAAHVPFWLLAGVYVAGMYAGPVPYPFSVTAAGPTPHFFEVYLRSLYRLLLQVVPFLLLAVVGSRWSAVRGGGRGEVFGGRGEVFFLAWLLVTLVPYSFVLYVDYLPSRHTYIPSVGTAGLVGCLFVRSWPAAAAVRWRAAWAALLAVCLVGNGVHLWRKDADYRARAAPTDELIEVLNRVAGGLPAEGNIALLGFPYPPVVARGAAHFFTSVEPDRLVFVREEAALQKPEKAGVSLALRWDGHAGQWVRPRERGGAGKTP